MKTMLIAAAIVGVGALSAQAQTPAPATAEPNPTPVKAAAATAQQQPKIRQPRRDKRAYVRPHGEPIVAGNHDIFVDSYGQLSTTMQP